MKFGTWYTGTINDEHGSRIDVLYGLGCDGCYYIEASRGTGLVYRIRICGPDAGKILGEFKKEMIQNVQNF